MRRAIVLVVAAAVAGCGYYPEPFVGHPGRLGARLALPPPPRLVVTPPTQAMLPAADAAVLARDLAQALAVRDVPAFDATPSPADWRLEIAADLEESAAGPMVLVTYTVRNPRGVAEGSSTAPPVSAQTWSMAAPTALKLVAQRDAPKISSLLSRIEAAVQLSDPNSLVNRPPRIVFLGVSGASGDGDLALGKAIVGDLATLGLVVQDTPSGADFALKGLVTMAAATPGQTRVEVLWTVSDLYGREVGHLVQMNDVPQGTLDHYWGDVAGVVAQQAAGGVKESIVNQTAARRIGSTKTKGALAVPPGTR